jgi:hypothetical protein
MAPKQKESGATRMASAHMFQAGQDPELDTLGLIPIRDYLNRRARYLRLVAQNNKADGVNVTPITVVASIDPELLENLIDMEEIDANSVDDCIDESVMEFLESTQERDAPVTAEFVFCHPDQFSRNSNVDDNSCSIVSSLPHFFTRYLRIETPTYINVLELFTQ